MRKQHEQELHKRQNFNGKHMKKYPTLSLFRKCDIILQSLYLQKCRSLTVPNVGKDGALTHY